MELALFTEPQLGGSYQRLVELARWCEAHGLDAFARSDHYLAGEDSAPVTDALTSIAGLATETERIHLAVLVSPLTFRHPGVLAKTAATIDEISGGRFELGIGTGWMEAEHEAFGIELYGVRERFSRLFETLSYLRAAFTSDEGYHGRHYDLEAGRAILPQPVRVPIIMGGIGMKKTPALAGRFADEYNMFTAPSDVIEQRVEVMRGAAAEAGRDPDSIKVSIASSVAIADTEEEYRESLAERAERRDMTAEEFEQWLADRNVPRGTPDTVGDALDVYAGLGVGRFYLQEYRPLDDIDTDALERVFNALRR